MNLIMLAGYPEAIRLAAMPLENLIKRKACTVLLAIQ